MFALVLLVPVNHKYWGYDSNLYFCFNEVTKYQTHENRTGKIAVYFSTRFYVKVGKKMVCEPKAIWRSPGDEYYKQLSGSSRLVAWQSVTDVSEKRAVSISRAEAIVLQGRRSYPTLKTEAAHSSETSAYLYQTTRRHIPEDTNLSNAKMNLVSSLKVNQSHYRPEVPRGFQEVKVPGLRDNGPGWW